MNALELKNILLDIPDDKLGNLNVWLGSDSGEGYPIARTAFIANAKFLPIDLDDNEHEHDYLTRKEYEKALSEEGVIIETILQPFDSQKYEVFREVLLIADYRAKKRYEYNVHEYKNKAIIEQKKKIERILQLKQEIVEIESELNELTNEQN